MEPWQNWLAVLAVGGAAYAYYTKTKDSGKRKTSDTSKRPAFQLKPDQSRKYQTVPLESPRFHVEDESASGTSTPKKTKKQKQKKEKTSQQTTPVPSAPTSVQDGDDEPEAASNDKEWAQQFSAARQGVKLSVPEKGQRQKSPKRSKGAVAAQESWDEPGSQGESTGNVSENKSQSVTARAGDVSDMLEPVAPGPSVVRVVGEEKPQKPKAPQSAPVVQETKKQRQNRRKAEEKKLAREQEEKDRKVLEENQRRTAREARGEPAKNGLGVPSVPTSNPWNQSTKTNENSTQTQSARVAAAPLLDTFEHDTVSTGSSNEHPNHSTPPSITASILDQDLPSEEAQMEMLNQMNGDAGWNEVTKSKKGKKKAPTSNASPERPVKDTVPKPNNQYASIATSDLINDRAKTPEPAPKKNEPAQKKIASTNGFAALEVATGFTPGAKGHPDDSDWAAD